MELHFLRATLERPLFNDTISPETLSRYNKLISQIFPKAADIAGVENISLEEIVSGQLTLLQLSNNYRDHDGFPDKTHKCYYQRSSTPSKGGFRAHYDNYTLTIYWHQGQVHYFCMDFGDYPSDGRAMFILREADPDLLKGVCIKLAPEKAPDDGGYRHLRDLVPLCTKVDW